MNSVIENIRILLPMCLSAWALFVAFTLWKPQRFRNSIFLLVALFSTALFIIGFFGDHFGIGLIVLAALIFIALLLVPIMLIYNGVQMIKRESCAVSNLLSLILGVIVGLGEIACFVSFLSTGGVFLRATKPYLFLFGVTVFYFSFWILTFVLYVLAIQYMPQRKQYAYVIIHGCGLIDGTRISKLLSNRVDKAIEIYHTCKVKPILIPSGGQGGDEKRSEAAAMTEYLLAQGIPEDHVLPEERSTTTMENLQYSFELIRQDGRQGRVALVSGNYHVYRCVLYAAKLKFKCTGVGAKVAWYYWPSATLREFAAIFTKWPHLFWILLGYFINILLPVGYYLFR